MRNHCWRGSGAVIHRVEGILVCEELRELVSHRGLGDKWQLKRCRKQDRRTLAGPAIFRRHATHATPSGPHRLSCLKKAPVDQLFPSTFQYIAYASSYPR